jgi:hypothetical protein
VQVVVVQELQVMVQMLQAQHRVRVDLAVVVAVVVVLRVPRVAMEYFTFFTKEQL